VAIAVKPSAGSHLYRPDGTELVGAAGQHIFIIIQQAELIPAIGQLIHDRLWLAGHGYFALAANGRLLERGLVDTSVWQPERLAFGRASCRNGVTQRFPDAQLYPGSCDDVAGEGRLLEIESLTPAEVAELASLKASARAAMATESKRVQHEWANLTAKVTADHRRAHGQSFTDEEEQLLTKAFTHAAEEGNLMPRGLVLYPELGDPVEASEVFANPSEWHGKRFADPFEPDYAGDPRIAWAAMEAGEPHIYSHAHGGMKYLFRTKEERNTEIAAGFEDLTRGAREKFQPISVDEFLDSPKLEWWVKDLLPKAGLGILYGASGSGKTFFHLDLMLAIAQGRIWNGHNVSPGRVVVIVAEGAAGMKGRLDAYGRVNSVDWAELPFKIIQDVPDLRTDGPALARAIEAAGGADIILVDTLAQTTPGVDENSSEGMGAVIGKCIELHAETGALVLLVSHTGKDHAKGVRGWSGLRAAADVEIEISAQGEIRVARVTKLKDGRDGAQYAFRLVPVELDPDDEGGEVSSCVIEFMTGPVKLRSKEPTGKNERIALRAARELADFDDEPIPQKSVIDLAISKMAKPEGPRDQRRQQIVRALSSLAEKDFLRLTNDGVIMPHLPHEAPRGAWGNEALAR
jgi:hypothetical protein